jgi:exosome complex component RRP45
VVPLPLARRHGRLQSRFRFERSDRRALCEVCIGDSRAQAVTTASVVPPFPDRPSEGFIHIDVDFSPMASPSVEVSDSTTLPCGTGVIIGGSQSGRQHPRATEIARLLEHTLRDSHAIDVEALCISSGDRVWDIHTHVTVLDDGGSLSDAAALAAVCSLRHFRRADVSVVGGHVVVHSFDERVPVPLSLHHSPVCVTFALFGPSLVRAGLTGGEDTDTTTMGMSAAAASSSSRLSLVPILDPTDREEVTCDGTLIVAVNAHGEICSLDKIGGAPVTTEELISCAEHASEHGKRLCEEMESALLRADAEQKKRDVERHAAGQKVGPAPAPSVMGPDSSSSVQVTEAAEQAVRLKRSHLEKRSELGGVWGVKLDLESLEDELVDRAPTPTASSEVPAKRPKKDRRKGAIE